jgi:hypothetical protein
LWLPKSAYKASLAGCQPCTLYQQRSSGRTMRMRRTSPHFCAQSSSLKGVDV